MHDNTLTQDNREKFIYLAGEYRQLVKFYNVEELCADKIAEMVRFIPSAKNSKFSVAALYRLVIPQILLNDIDKAIYLDSDIIVNLDIRELWRIELDEKVLGVIPEALNGVDAQKGFKLVADNLVKPDEYFNSGVLLINLKILRNEWDTIITAIKFIGEHPEYSTYLDQEILNYSFSTRTLKLPVKYNILVNNWLHEKIIKKVIYHFAGGAFRNGMNNRFNRLWMKYFMKTPWFDEETIGRLYSSFQQIHVSLKQSMVNLSAMMSGKTRAFFTLPRDIDGLKKFFSIRDDEEIILAENQTSLQKLLDAMKKSQGKKVFFIMLPNFPFQALIQAGFVPNRDFVNGLEFLSEAQGLPLNSYQFINAM